MTTYDPRFPVPGNMQIVGPSLSGKTTWLYRVVRDVPAYFRHEDGSPCYFRKVVYCYGSSWQPIFDHFRVLGVHFHPGLPEDVTNLFPLPQRPGMLILDDLMQETAKSPQITQLLTRSTHHLDLFTITLSQNLYQGGREQASQNHNYHYSVLFKNPADTRYVKALGNGWLGDSRAFWQMYKKATHRPFGYLVIDHHPRTDEVICFHTHILLDEAEPVMVLQAKPPTRSKKDKKGRALFSPSKHFVSGSR